MTIETKTKITVAGVTVEREFRWDALSGLPFLTLTTALIARLGEADRIDQTRNDRETNG